jgi:outer membrane protein OmpA-like peptidoglycan-associated protein
VLEKSQSTPSPSSTTEDQKPTDSPQTIKVSQLRKIASIYFNNNEYFLDAEDRKILSDSASWFTGDNQHSCFIEGNTDIKRGVDNVLLSKNRAEAVRKYMMRNLLIYNCSSVWFASTRPVAFGTSQKALSMNRRVDIFVKESVEEAPQVTQSSVAKISLDLMRITFNRNEYFLDARDRAILLRNVTTAIKARCLNITLQGSRDTTKGLPNETIAENRAKAVKIFMRAQYPLLKFIVAPAAISSNREVAISCSS